METIEIIKLVEAIAVIVVGVIILAQNRMLKSQIKSQTSLIENLHGYNEIIDIGKLKEYVEVNEMRVTTQSQIDKDKLEKQVQETLKKYHNLQSDTKLLVSEIISRHAEMIVKVLGQENRQEYINKHLPLSKESYQLAVKNAEALYEPDGKDKSVWQYLTVVEESNSWDSDSGES